MFTYKCEIQSGPMLEIKYYQSLRKRNKKNMSRSINRAITSEKMAQANRIRGEQHTQRLILANFKQGDWWVRFSAPYQNFTEEEFEKIVSNFFKRIITQKSNACSLSTSVSASVVSVVATGICT